MGFYVIMHRMKLQFEQLPLPSYLPTTEPADLATALDLYDTLMRDDYGSTARARRALTLYDLRMAQTYVTKRAEDGAVLAVASYDPDYRLKGAALINGLVVHPDSKKQGVGRYTIDRLAEASAERGLDRLRVRSLSTAIGFYARLGFEYDEIITADPELPYMSLDVRKATLPSPRRHDTRRADTLVLN